MLGLLAFVYVTAFLGRSGAIAIRLDEAEIRTLIIAALLFIAVEYPRARWSARRHFHQASAWLDRLGSPTLAEARAFGSIPRRHAASVFVEWTVASAIATVIHGLRDPSLVSLLVLFIGGTVFGLHIAGTVYLLVERALRPGFRRLAEYGASLEDGEPGIATRLISSWVLCAGVATFGAALIVGWSDDARSVDLSRALLPLAAFVIIEGGALTLWAVRSVSGSVHDLQSALHRVEGGDLDVRLDIDDRTEIGAVRRSFNSMVKGLRDGAHVQRLLDGQVGPEVARVTRSRGIQLAGERQQASILTVDMIGSTAFAEGSDPEEIIAVLNGYFDLVVQRVITEGGNVLQFQGDGVLCVFGAPSSVADHEQRALRAARGLRSDLVEFRQADHPGFDAAIAVSTGTVVGGHVGNADRFSYTVIGDVVNEACRLVDEAKSHPARVLATSSAVSRCGDEARWWRSASPRRLRGRAALTAVHCPISVTAGLEPRNLVRQERDGEPASVTDERGAHDRRPTEAAADVVEHVIEHPTVVAVEGQRELHRIGRREIADGDTDQGAAVGVEVTATLGEELSGDGQDQVGPVGGLDHRP